MDRLLRNSLIQLGLTEKETKFFEACFKIGPASINEIARTARLERSTAYLITQQLLEKDLLEEDFRQYKKKLIASEPKKLLRLLASKQRSIQRLEMEIEENLPNLQAAYQASNIRPNVRVFDGNRGLQTIRQDIFTAKKEILLWTNQETESLFFSKELHDKFIAERTKRSIHAKVLAVNNRAGVILQEDDTNNLRQTKLLPREVEFSAETYIYENRVAIIDYKKDIIGVIIESEPIAAAQKAIFEMNWKLLQPSSI